MSICLQLCILQNNVIMITHVHVSGIYPSTAQFQASEYCFIKTAKLPSINLVPVNAPTNHWYMQFPFAQALSTQEKER